MYNRVNWKNIRREDCELSRKIKIVTSLIILLSFIFAIILLTKSNKSSTLGEYFGVSEDNKWETQFRVFKNLDNEIMLKGYVKCVDDNIFKKFDLEDIDKNVITVFKSNGYSFGGNYIVDKNNFIIINYVNNDGSVYKKMDIAIGTYTNNIKISKIQGN